MGEKWVETNDNISNVARPRRKLRSWKMGEWRKAGEEEEEDPDPRSGWQDEEEGKAK